MLPGPGEGITEEVARLLPGSGITEKEVRLQPGKCVTKEEKKRWFPVAGIVH